MIHLAYPAGLLALLAIPLLIALHLLQPRRRRVLLATTELWQAALAERRTRHGFRRLLRNLSLLLLLAAALVLGLALAAPEWLTSASEDAEIVLVLDVSASMQTRSGIAGTRFEQARAEAARMIDALPRDGRMLIMTSGKRAVLRSGFETDRGALRRVLGELGPGDEAGRPREALALALSLIRSRPRARIHFLTDGAFDPAVDPGSPQVLFRVVGAPARNIAITRFDLRQERASEDRFQVLMTVRNYSDAPVRVPATASLDGRELFRRTLELPAGGQQTVVLPVNGRALGQAIARIDVNDDLAADNQAFAVVSAPHALRVLLLSRGNLYLESALDALPETELVRMDAASDEDLARLARRFDVVVIDAMAAPQLPPGNFLLVDTVPPGLPFADAGRVAQPRIAGNGPSALMHDLDLAAVRIDTARRVAFERRDPGVQRLFWSAETDLALAHMDADRKLVYLGFDLAASSFPLQAAFPLFVSRSLEWLSPRADARVANQVAAGSIHTIRLPAGEQQVTVRTPAGHAVTLAAQDGAILYPVTAAGIYRYDAGDAARYFAANLADARESDVNTRWARGEGAEASRPTSSDAQAIEPLWPTLLLIALALLVLEWVIWARSRSA